MKVAKSGKRLHARMAARVTISEVAKDAGVSTATVSRILNTPGRVNAQTRERVARAIVDLGYVPNGAARALATRRTHTIAAVVPTIDNPIFAHFIGALQRRLAAAGMVILLANSEYDHANEVAQLRALIQRGTDGIILVGAAHDPEAYALLTAKKVPFVNTWTSDRGPGWPCIGFDNQAAACRVASYLLDLGHRRIAMIAGLTRYNDRAAARVRGVREALAAKQLALSPDQLLECRYAMAEGRSALRTLLGVRDRPTAVICGNDILAFGVMAEARAAGLRIPQDLSITGFDDLELAAQFHPGLTTVRAPAAEMGALAAEYLLAQLDSMSVPECRELEAQLIVRGSTAPPLISDGPTA